MEQVDQLGASGFNALTVLVQEPFFQRRILLLLIAALVGDDDDVLCLGQPVQPFAAMKPLSAKPKPPSSVETSSSTALRSCGRALHRS